MGSDIAIFSHSKRCGARNGHDMTKVRQTLHGRSDRRGLLLLGSIAVFILVAVGGLAVALLSSSRGASATPPPPGSFVLIHDSTKAGCPADGSIALPFKGDLDARVNWGDGSSDSWSTGQTPTHTYSTSGTHTIEVSHNASQFGNGDTTWVGAKCITSVVQWGDLGLTSLSGALSGATNLTSVPDWIPAEVTDLSFMFDGATSFNGKIGSWNTAAVTSLEGTFRGATSFNQSLNTWNTALVTTFAETFNGASAFNRPINNWTTSLATTFRAMFKNASAFNQPINIDPRNATDASEMFRGASAFNRYFSMWTGGAAYGTTLKGMFRDATSFNQRVDWNTPGITDTSDMFRGATSFNASVNSLVMYTVTDASHMFDGATSFDGELGAWQTSSMVTMNSMFRGATSFNHSLATFATGNVTDMAHMFDGATSFNNIVNNFSTSSVTSMNSMFSGARNFNSDITGWDVSRVGDAGSMFAGATNFDQSLANWQVGSMTNMSHMFDGATVFGRSNSGAGGVGNWNISSVADMTSAFANTNYFNESLDNWATINLERALGVFAHAGAFDQSLAAWDTTHLVDGDGIGIEYSGISTANYSKSLAGWGRQAQPSRPANSIRLDATDKTFDRLWEQSRRFVLTTKGWDIRDAGRASEQTPLSMSYDFTAALTDATVLADGGVTVYLPLSGQSRLTVDWGDGSRDSYSAGSPIFHFYSLIVGDPELDVTYTVSVTGQATNFDSRVGQGTGMSYVSAINTWGQIGLTSLDHALSNMTGLKTAIPALPPTVRTLAHMYDGLVSASAASGVIAPSATWVTTNVIDMSSMFADSNILISSLSGWNTSNVIDMSSMFSGDPAGPHPSIAALDLSSWNVANVENMDAMFRGTDFNGSINGWNVGKVRSMAGMFARATSFNKPLDLWNISSVRNLSSMFEGATAFNRPLATWNTRSAANFHAMFDGASTFDQSLSTWSIANSADMSDFLSGSGISATNYGATLDGFYRSSTSSVALGAAGVLFDSRGAIARAHLYNERGWSFTGDALAAAGAPMVMTFDSAGTACGTNDVNLPLGGIRGDLSVDWGDGADPVTYRTWESVSHTYAATGTYEIEVRGVAEHFGADNWQGLGCITKVSSYGDLGLTDLSSAWSYSTHLTQLPPLPARVTNTSRMFFNASTFNLPVNDWDTSNVTDMSQMFYGATLFNQNLSNWNTSKVTSMSEMFCNAVAFNGNISTWNTSNVTTMYQMFYNAQMFNSPIGAWNVSNVSSMFGMFILASSFDQPIGNWNTASLTSMSTMFQSASSFNQPLVGWDVSHVPSMNSVFWGASRFNGDLSTWDTSNVTDFYGMFNGASDFNAPIGQWDVSRGQSFVSMFESSGFNQPIGEWTMRAAQNLQRMFASAQQFNQDLPGWEMTSVTNVEAMFAGATAFNGDISNWNTSGITWVQSMFQGATSFNRDLSSWNLDRIGVINYLFYGASSFNQSLGNWNLATMTQAYDVFTGTAMSTRNYTDTLTGWADQVSRGDMASNGYMRVSKNYFAEAQSSVDLLRSYGWTIQDGGQYQLVPMTIVWQPDYTECGSNSLSLAFGGPTVDGFVMWGDGAKTDLTSPGTVSHTYTDSDAHTITVYGEIATFGNGTELAGTDCITGVGQWGHLNLMALPGAFRGWSNLVNFPTDSPGQVTDTSNAFRDATRFSSDLGWDMSAVRNASHMFDGAKSFNGGVEGWNMGSVTDASYMFAGATSFNRNIGDWQFANMRNLSHMLDGATSFSTALQNWITSQVTDMSYMLRNTGRFNQDIQSLNLSSVTDMTGMLDGSGLSTHNYDQALKAWSSRPTKKGVTLGAIGRGYRSDAAAARLSLTGSRNWIILDDGPAPEAPMVLVFDTTMEGCGANLYIPLAGVLGATVDWGDDSTPTVLGVGNDWPYHEYAQGTFTVTISGEAAAFGNGGEWPGARCLKSVTSFGEMGMTSFYGAFYNAVNLRSVSSTMTSTVTDMRSMFTNAGRFNSDLSGWNTSKVTAMVGMFAGAAGFNGDISTWNTSKVTDMSEMFNGAVVFNRNITTWDVGNVVAMTRMFSSASAFNQNIGTWNVHEVVTMEGMFSYAYAFTGDLSAWDIRKVVTLNSMFYEAQAFNGDISSWNLASATDLNYMFSGARSWNHSMGQTKLPKLQSAWDLFNRTSMSARNYSDTIIGWWGQLSAGNMRPNVNFGSSVQYLSDAATARQGLIDTGWAFQDYGAYDLTPMTMNWDPTGTACSSSELDLAFSGPNLAGSIDWGDGTTPTTVTSGINSHTYTDTDPHTVSVSGQISTFGNGTALTGGPCITSVGQWGNLQMTAMPGAFRGWSKLATVPNNAPGAITDFSNTFRDATVFNSELYWSLGSATTTAHMFDGAKAFNGWIDGWDMTNVIDASYMFAGATSFNRYTDSWPMTNVRNLSHIFDGASNFAGYVLNWRPSKVTDLSYAFRGVRSFDTDLSNFDISNVTDMTGIFTNSGLTTYTYDKILNAWAQLDVKRNVTLGASGRPYKSIASAARTHLVTDKGWTVIDDGLEAGGSMKFTLDTTAVGCDPNIWMPFHDIRDLTIDWGDGSDVVHQGVGSDWINHYFGTSGVYHVEVSGDVYMLGNPGSTWSGAGCLTSVESFGGLGLRTIASAFEGAGNLTAAPASLPVSVTDTRRLFYNSSSFNDDISGWDVSRVTEMSEMFGSALSFDQPLDGWDVSNVKNMNGVFAFASSFDQPLDGWDVSNATSMTSMFIGARKFDQPLDSWDVSQVRNMEWMFHGAWAFNGDISSWKPSSATAMGHMFRDARAFNQPLDGWDVSHVTDMTYMFLEAAAFDQSLASWHLDRLQTAYDLLSGSHVSPLNYGRSLIGWASAPTTPNTVTMSNNMTYSKAAQASRESLVNRGWTLNDYGQSVVSPMMLTVDNRLASCSGLTQTLPVSGSFRDEVSIDWGDGTTTPVVEGTIPSHTYAVADLYTISINGLPGRFGSDVTGTEATYTGADCITAVTSWGGTQIDSLEGAFRGAKNLTSVPNWIPSTVRNLSWMFAGATSFNHDAVNSWEVSNVPDLSHMFEGATSFNTNLNSWNVAYVRDMSSMFKGASSFQGYVTYWHPERTTNMSSMFENAPQFNADIRNWEVASVTNMAHMFDGSGLTTWTYDILLNAWSLQNLQRSVTLGASTTYYRAKATAARTHMVEDLGWTVTDLGLLADIPMVMTIDTSKAECNGAVSFPFTSIRDMTIDFGDGSEPVVLGPGNDYPTHTYGTVDVFTVTVHGEVDAFGQFGGWPGAGCLTSMSSFGELGTVSLASAFATAVNLTTVPTTLPSTVTDASRMFASAAIFNQDISGWDVSHVTSMQAMFQNAYAFNQPIGSWNTSRVSDLSWMFQNAYVFNQDLANWNTSRVTTLEGTFNTASAFNGTVAGWNTSRVENMNYVFSSAAAFNRPVDAWNFSNVVMTAQMFYGATSFDQPVGSWNTGRVTNMQEMFRFASSFNQSLNSWDVSKVVYMSNMLSGASTFDQPLDGWHLASLQSGGELIHATAVTPNNYARSLIAWAADPLTARGVYMTNWSVLYSASAATARSVLTGSLGWMMADAGMRSSVPMTLSVDTSFTGCDASTIEMPVGGVVYDTPVVDWGDGSTTFLADGAHPSHLYATAGQYTVSVSGVFSHFGDVSGYQGAQCITGITGWGETAVTDLSGAFKGATNLAALPTLPSAVTDLSSAFADNPTFNLDMSGWNVSNVAHFDNMFAGSTSFDSDITGWNVGAAKTMNGMFRGATSFDQDISVWDVSNVTSMNSMFDGATAFDHSLAGWMLKSVTSMSNGFARSSISEANWTTTLIGWNLKGDLAHDVAIDASGHTWLAAARSAHTNLTTTLGWVFTNDGGLVDVPVITSVPSGVHGDRKVTVSWTALTDVERVGAAIDQYTVSAFNGSGGEVGSCQPTPLTGLTCEVSGLTNGTAYTFKLKAHNRIGWSENSLASSSVTPSTVPAKAVIASTASGDRKVTVNWTAPTNNGAPITGYVVTTYAGGTLVAGKTCSPTPATGLTCDVTGLTNGTAYTFKLVASNLNGPGPESNASSNVTPLGPPSAPAAPTAVRGNGQATVSWATPDSNGGTAITGYTVVALINGLSSGRQCIQAPGAGLSCVITGLTNGTAYTFKVAATNGIGIGESEASLPVTPATTPSAPAAPSATRGNAKVTVTWVAPANGGSAITGYTVSTYAGGTLVAGRTCSPTPATGLTCDVTGLTNGTAYTFKVKASNEVGPGQDSAPSSAVTPIGAPAAPAAPSVTRGDSKVTVTWVAPANGGSAITGYTVSTYAGGTLVAGKTCSPTPATGLTCDVTGLTNGTAYTFKVKATNAINSSADSVASVEVTPATTPSAPAAPSVTRGNAKVTVTWVAPANNGSAITGYTVSTYAGGTLVAGKTCSPTPATGLTCDVTGLTNGTAYTFKVKATNAVNPGPDSPASTAVTPATTPNAPAAPTTVRGDAQVTVNWVAPANGGSVITGYTVTTYAAGVVVAGRTCSTASATTVTCNITGLTNGTAYTFTVTATNALGSAESVASAAVTPGAAPAQAAAPTVVKGHQSVQVSWVAPAANGSAITGYTVTAYTGSTAVTGKTCPLSTPTATTCIMTGLTNGTAYTFKVKATNAIGSTDSVASAAVTPAAVPVAPTAPRVSVGAAVGAKKATITWTAPANNGSVITGFTVTAYTAAGASAGTCSTTSVTALSCSITGLTTGTTYTFKVTAKNANGNSFSSPGTTGTPT